MMRARHVRRKGCDAGDDLGFDRAVGLGAGARVTDFLDEHTNPEARVALPPRVIEWAENMTKSARFYQERDGYTAEDVAGFDALLAFARGEK